MKILLTGASGFIGSAFARLALDKGHTVAGLILPGERLPSWSAGRTNLVWLPGTLEEPPWEDIVAFGAQACVHTAWITTPGIYLESPENERLRDLSLRFLRRLGMAGTGQILALGTCIEYRITNAPLREDDTPVAPTTTYSRCKNELRLALEHEAGTHGFRVCWGRVFYPYGPGEHPSRLCSAILQKLIHGESMVLKTPESIKDYIYIDDLAAALLTVLDTGFAGTINLGTSERISVRQIAGHLGALVGHQELISEAMGVAPDPFPFVVADTAKLRQLGWRPLVPLEEGLRRLVVEHGISSPRK